MATEREDVELSISAIIDGASIDDLTKVLTSGVEKATTQGGKRAGKQYAEHIAAAVDEGVRSASDSKTVKDFAKKVLRAEEMQKQIVAAYEKGDKEHGKFLERERKKEIAHLKKVADRRKQHFAEYSRLQSRTFTETADDFNDKLSSGIGKLFSGNIDVGGMLKGAGKKMQQKGDAAVQRGKMADASKGQRMMGGVGKAMAGVGAGMMAFGAVAAILIVLVKAFIDIHDKVAEMNQSFAATAGAADFGLGTAAVRAGEFTAKLDSVRESVLAFSSKLGPDAWFVSSKDLFAILGGMNEMNYRFEEMEKNIENNVHGLSSFSDHAVMAVAYGKLLGVTGLEMGQNMAKMANEFGVGLNVIAEGLSMVHQEAMLSGFSTKRFYSTILEVTSGLGAYNVRLTEASSLLTMMGAALGQAEGSKAFKALAGEGFQNMDPVEALKAILLRGGPEKVQDIFADEAKAKAEQLFVGMDEAQRKAFGEKFNLDTSSAAAFGESFAKAAPAQKAVRDELARTLYKTGGPTGKGVAPEAASAGYAAAGLAKAGKGDLDRMAANMGKLGAASRMRFMMRLPELLGFDNMAQAMEEGNIPELKAALDTIGISMEEFSRSSELVGRLESEFKDLKKEAKKVGVGERMDRGQYGTVQKLGGGKFQRVIKDALGNWIPQGGVFKDVDTYVGAMNDYVEQETKVVDAELEAAQKMSRETEKVANALEDNIAKILNDIYIVVRDILNWLLGSDKKRAQQTAAGKTLLTKIAGDEKKAKTALGKAKAAHETAQSTPGANTTATGAAVTAAQGDVDKFGALRAAATELDPGSFGSYEEYEKSVYKKAGVDRTGGKGPPPGGAKKQSKSREKQQKDLGGQSLPEAYGEEGWSGLASWLAGGESGITSWTEFVNYMNEFWPNSGVPKADQTAFMDYWKAMFALRILQQNPHLAGEYSDEDLFVGRYVGAGVPFRAWQSLRDEGDLLSGMQDLTKPGPIYDSMMAGYREQLPFLNSSYHQPEEQNPNSGGPTVPEAKGHYEKGKWVYDDVFIPSNGQPIALNSKDDVLAMKPGGAVDKAMGGRGGSGSPVTINVRGGNPREVMDAVIKGINIANGKPFA